MKENGDKLSDEDKATVESELEAFKKVKEGGNAQEMKDAIQGFTEKVYAIFGKIYQQEAEAQPGASPNPEAGSENPDGTVNTDFDVK